MPIFVENKSLQCLNGHLMHVRNLIKNLVVLLDTRTLVCGERRPIAINIMKTSKSYHQESNV